MPTTYLENVKTIIQNHSSIFINYSSTIKIYSTLKGFIEGRIIFVDESVLDFMEVKDIEEELKEKYKYHYMDKDKNLIFRYDNSKHHKEIATFPHHKHTPNGIEESSEPNIEEIMKEIEKIISRNK